MQRYFFNVEDGQKQVDDEGIWLADLPTAKVAAAQLLGTLLNERAAAFCRVSDWQIEVADEHGLVLFSILACACDAPAIDFNRPG